MTKEEKIMLYELLGKYIDELEPETKRYPVPDNRVEFASLLMMQRHISCMEEIRISLAFDF